jgi:hypothetical protein
MATEEAAGGSGARSVDTSERGSVTQDNTPQIGQTTYATPVPGDWQGEIDAQLWGKRSQFEELVSPSRQQNNGHILYLTILWEKKREQGRDLWYVLTDEVGGWSQEQWENTSPALQRYLRRFLIENGVYVETRNGLRIAIALYNIASSQEYPFWNPSQIEEWKQKSNVFRRQLEDPDFVRNITPESPNEPLGLPATIRNASPYSQIQEQAQTPVATRPPSNPQPYLQPRSIPQPREHSAPPIQAQQPV